MTLKILLFPNLSDVVNILAPLENNLQENTQYFTNLYTKKVASDNGNELQPCYTVQSYQTLHFIYLIFHIIVNDNFYKIYFVLGK